MKNTSLSSCLAHAVKTITGRHGLNTPQQERKQTKGCCLCYEGFDKFYFDARLQIKLFV